MDTDEKAVQVSLSIYPSLWHAFRLACLQRKKQASTEVQRLIAKQLAAWQRQSQKETDHV